MEECADTLAFASEPVLASLANVLAYKEQLANTLAAQSTGLMGKQNHPPTSSYNRSTFVKEYELLELEVKYGLLQVRELRYRTRFNKSSITISFLILNNSSQTLQRTQYLDQYYSLIMRRENIFSQKILKEIRDKNIVYYHH